MASQKVRKKKNMKKVGCNKRKKSLRSFNTEGSRKKPSDWYLSTRRAAANGEAWAFEELMACGLSVHRFDEDKKWTQNYE